MKTFIQIIIVTIIFASCVACGGGGSPLTVDPPEDIPMEECPVTGSVSGCVECHG
jgi:hypothetical protein